MLSRPSRMLRQWIPRLGTRFQPRMRWHKRQSCGSGGILIPTTYELEVAGLSQRIPVGQTIRAVIDQYLAGRRIQVVDGDLLVLGVKERMDAEGTVPLATLTVANSDRWPEDDDHLVAGNAVRTQSQSSHLQVGQLAERALAADTAAAVSDANVALLNAANLFAALQSIRLDDALNNAVSTVAGAQAYHQRHSGYRHRHAHDLRG
jgi:hypothetical protein